MKKIIVVLLLTLVPYLLFSQKGKWNKTMDENTIEAYEEFIAKYPKSEFVIEANNRLVSLKDYEIAKSKNTINSYEEFLKKHPNSEFGKEIEDQLIILNEFEITKTKNTVEAFESFIEKYPNCNLIEDASKKIKLIVCENIKIIKTIYNTTSDLDELFYNPEDDIAKNLINEGYQVVTQNSQTYDAVMTIEYKEQKRNPSFAMENSLTGTVDETILFYAEIICIIKVNNSKVGEIFSTEININSKKSQFQESRKIGEPSSLHDKVNWNEHFSEAISILINELNEIQFKNLIIGDIDNLIK